MENSNLQNNPPQNPFYKYSLKQRKESEEFGRLTIDYIKRQNENLQQLFSESEIVESRIKDYCRCKEKIIEQEHLIGSLKYRIEQLEASIVIKNQDINNYLNIIRKSKEEMELKENRETLDTKQKCHKADSELSRKDHMTSKISSISSNDNENKQTKQVQDPPIYTITIGEIIKKYAGKVQESQKQKQGNIMISDSLLDIPSTSNVITREILKQDENLQPTSKIDESQDLIQLYDDDDDSTKLEQSHLANESLINKLNISKTRHYDSIYDLYNFSLYPSNNFSSYSSSQINSICQESQETISKLKLIHNQLQQVITQSNNPLLIG